MAASWLGWAPQNDISGMLGQSLGQGLSQGIGDRLQAMRQKKVNQQTAGHLAESLGIPDSHRPTFVSMFENLSPKEQFAAYNEISKAKRNQAEAMAYQQAFSGQQEQQNDFFNEGQQPFNQQAELAMMGGAQQEKKILDQSLGRGPQNINSEQTEIPAQEEMQEVPSQYKVKFGGQEIDKRDLPIRKKPTPHVGVLQGQAKAEEKVRERNHKEIREFAEPYKDVSKLKANRDKLKEAKRLIEHGNIDTGTLQKAVTAILEGKNSPIAEMTKSADQQKLFFLMRDALKTKEIGGSNPSTKEVLLTLESVPNYLKGKEANLYIANRMLDEADSNVKRGEFIKTLQSYDDSMNPSRFEQLVDKYTQPKEKGLDLEKQEPASKHAGRTIRDKETGLQFRSDGKKWVQV